MAPRGRRHQAREIALQALFLLESDPEQDPKTVLAYLSREADATPPTSAFAAELVDGVLANRLDLDNTIREASTNWSLEQMGKIDRMVLRIAIYEIAIARNVPVRAAINESIELAKTYGEADSGRFVNGILGRVASTA
ncbi:MAG: transcription antitermination factor NusB [Candidatus Dormibacteraeota bacterium]|nr:transcription antitermination factor NusB [Candidatus Dormibacteraeota bacterium]